MQTMTIATTNTGRAAKRDAEKFVAAMEQRTTAVKRSVDDYEARQLLTVLPTARQRVRIYSAEGFVPNSYRYACSIEFIEAERSQDGWTVTIGKGDAKRSRGAGSLVVVQ